MVLVKQLEVEKRDAAVDKINTLQKVGREVDMSDKKQAPKKGLLIKMSQALHTDLKIQAIRQNTDMTTIVIRLIEKFIKESNK